MSSIGPVPHTDPPPSMARVYDYALGGKDNYPVDRQLFDKLTTHYPVYQAAARANRGFLQRSVTRFAESGIQQYLDLGSGIPTPPNVHEVARALTPDAAVVYTDNDQTAFVHGQAFLSGIPGVEYVRHDVTDIAGLLASDEVAGSLDLRRPVAVLAYAVFHFVADEVVREMLGQLRSALAPGSMLAFSVASATREYQQANDMEQASERMSSWANWQFVLRTPEAVAGLVEGFEVLPPGIVDIQDWPSPHPDPVTDLLWTGAVVRLTEPAAR